MTKEEEKPRVNLAGGVVPVTAILGLLGLVGAGAAWMARIDMRLSAIESNLARIVDDGMTDDEFRAWVELLRARNPQVDIPDPPD